MVSNKLPCVYIITNFGKTVLYTGVTSNLEQRSYQHKNETFDGLSKKYKCKYLVYYEVYDTMYDTITREKQIKGYARKKKKALISQLNPKWKDLSVELFG